MRDFYEGDLDMRNMKDLRGRQGKHDGITELTEFFNRKI
jgi:hypothetical protein